MRNGGILVCRTPLKKSVFLPDDVVDALKRMNPREVVNILVK